VYKQPIGRSILLFSLLCAASTLRAVPPETSTSTGSAVTLEQCYQKALQVSENLAISDQEIDQIAAIYRQGVGNALPYISWQMTQFWQDTSSVTESSTGVQGTLLRNRRPESFFQIEQPLFHGLRDFNAVKGFKAAKRSSELTKKQAELNLLADVAEVFYTSLDLQQELASLHSQRDLTEDRLKELQRRVRLGRSRDSEVISSQVELASLDAQLEDTRQRWHVARQTLQFLTEVPLSVPLVEESPVPTLPTVEDAHAKSMARPDLLAAGFTQEQERYRVRYAKGGYFPGLDITGKYYTERVGFNEDVKWDALLSLEVPIFRGFITRAEVQEARSQQIIADLNAARLKRQVRQEVETAHQNLRYATSQSQFYEKAVNLAQQNYKLQLEEYRLGLINNLQVLQVLTDLQDLKIRKLRSDAAMRVGHVRLRVATGQGL
jgi:outer membrane protein